MSAPSLSVADKMLPPTITRDTQDAARWRELLDWLHLPDNASVEQVKWAICAKVTEVGR